MLVIRGKNISIEFTDCREKINGKTRFICRIKFDGTSLQHFNDTAFYDMSKFV